MLQSEGGICLVCVWQGECTERDDARKRDVSVFLWSVNVPCSLRFGATTCQLASACVTARQTHAHTYAHACTHAYKLETEKTLKEKNIPGWKREKQTHRQMNGT